MADIIQLRRGLTANWSLNDPILAKGEIGLEDTGSGVYTSIKIGDGLQNYSALPYFGGDLITINHNTLLGLTNDDHAQYHNDVRGDVRYYTKSEITTFLSGKADTIHTHTIADVTGLQLALDSKANQSHSHTIANVTGLQLALDAKSDTGHIHVIADTTGLQLALDGKSATVHTHVIADTTGLQLSLDGKENTSNKDIAGGYAGLDASGLILPAQLPSFVDDVLEYVDLASFPLTGLTGKIYVALDTNIIYRWSGTTYIVISSTLALGETSSTAYRGDRGKIAYDHSLLVVGNPHSVTKSEVGLPNVDNTSDINKPISNATQVALDAKKDELVKVNIGGVAGFLEDKIIGGTNILVSTVGDQIVIETSGTGTNSDIALTHLVSQPFADIDYSMIWDTQQSTDADFTHVISSSDVTINTDSEYIISYSITVEGITGNSRSEFTSELQINGVIASGSFKKGYIRTSGAGNGDSVSLTGMNYNLTNGDIIKLVIRRTAGTTDLEVSANSASLRIENKTGVVGFPHVDNNTILTLLSPSDGLIIWNTDRKEYVFFNGTNWLVLGSSELITPLGQGTGLAGTFTEGWENNFLTDWSGNINGDTVSTEVTSFWNKHSGDTPSNGTGSSGGAQSGTFYIYAEMSNGGGVTEYLLETTNFKTLTDIDFFYNMFGADIGLLEVQYFNISNGIWTTVFSNNVDGGDLWIPINVDMFGLGAEKVRFRVTGTTGYAGDVCLDNVVFTSV